MSSPHGIDLADILFARKIGDYSIETTRSVHPERHLLALSLGTLPALAHCRLPYCCLRVRALLPPHVPSSTWTHAPPDTLPDAPVVLWHWIHSFAPKCARCLTLSHPSVKDVRMIAARAQIAAEGNCPPLMELLCPFQLPRMVSESAREKVRWVGAIWYVIILLQRSLVC